MGGKPRGPNGPTAPHYKPNSDTDSQYLPYKRKGGGGRYRALHISFPVRSPSGKTYTAYIDTLASGSFVRKEVAEAFNANVTSELSYFTPGHGPAFEARALTIEQFTIPYYSWERRDLGNVKGPTALWYRGLTRDHEEKIKIEGCATERLDCFLPADGEDIPVDIILGMDWVRQHRTQQYADLRDTEVEVTLAGKRVFLQLSDEHYDRDGYLQSLMHCEDEEELILEVLWQVGPPPLPPEATAAQDEGIMCPLSADSTKLGRESTETSEPFPIIRSSDEGLEPFEDVSEAQLQQLRYLLHQKHVGVFSPHEEVPTARIPGEEFVITLKPGAQPKSFQGPRISEHMQDDVKALIDGWVKRGMMEVETQSPWGAPLIVVHKRGPDGKVSGLRTVYDYRYLNSQTEKYNWPLPRIDELLNKLGRSKIYSCVDLQDGFYQLPVAKESQHLTTVATPWGLFRWTVLPMGVANGPSVFSRMVSRIFQDLAFTNVYIDDAALGSMSVDEHLDHIDKFLSTCAANNIRLKPSKCAWLLKSCHFLGHRVAFNKLTPMLKHTEALERWPAPKTRKEMSSFLGVANYYREFIPRYAHIAAPLYEWCCTSKQKGREQVIWDPQNVMHRAFITLKNSICNKVLAVHDPNKPIRISTDASEQVGYGCVVEQDYGEDGKENWRPISFFSRKWSPAQEKYGVPAKELTCIFESLKRYRHWLIGREFYVQTDSSVCTYYESKSAAQLSTREVRQLDFFSQFAPFTIKHLAGHLNVVPDALSRVDSYPSGLSLRVVDLYAGSPTTLRAIQRICHKLDITYVDYQCVEINARNRQTIKKVHDSLLRDPKVPITPDCFRLSHLVDHDVRLMSQPELMHSGVKKFLEDADVVLGGPPCQPFSRATANPRGLRDSKQGFSSLIQILKHARLKNYVFENVKFHHSLDKDLATIEAKLGSHVETICQGPQQRVRWLFTTLPIKPQTTQTPPICTWQDCLTKAAVHEQRKPAICKPLTQGRSYTLMASRNTHTERWGTDKVGEGSTPPQAWVQEDNKSSTKWRTMTILEREYLCGLESGDTKVDTEINDNLRYVQTGNAIPVWEIETWLDLVLEKSRSTTPVNQGSPDETIGSYPLQRSGAMTGTVDSDESGTGHKSRKRRKKVSFQLKKNTKHVYAPLMSKGPQYEPIHDSQGKMLVSLTASLNQAIQKFHCENGHHGARTTANQFIEALALGKVEGFSACRYPFSVVLEAAKQVVSMCKHCLSWSDIGNDLGLKRTILPFPISREPFRDVHVDTSIIMTKTSEGYDEVLAIVDRLTGYVDAYPSKKAFSHATKAVILNSSFRRFGYPTTLTVDEGFKSEVFDKMSEFYGFHCNVVPPDRHEQNGTVERVMRELKKKLAACLHEDKVRGSGNKLVTSWDVYLSEAICIINNTPKERLNSLSSNEYMLGRKISPAKEQPIEEKWKYLHEIAYDIARSNHLKRKRKIDSENQGEGRSDPIKYKEGDLVLIKRTNRTKLQSPWFGPKTVTKVLESDTYELDSEIRRHHTSLKKYVADEHYDDHDDNCSACDDGGEVMMCSHCHRSYHAECLGYETPPEVFTCPHCIGSKKSASEEVLLKNQRNQWGTRIEILRDIQKHIGKTFTVDLCASEQLHVVPRWTDDAIKYIREGKVKTDDVVFCNPPYLPSHKSRQLIRSIVAELRQRGLGHTLYLLVPEYLAMNFPRLKTYKSGTKLFKNTQANPDCAFDVFLCSVDGDSTLPSDQMNSVWYFFQFRKRPRENKYEVCCLLQGFRSLYWVEWDDALHLEDFKRYVKDNPVVARNINMLPPSLRYLWNTEAFVPWIGKHNVDKVDFSKYDLSRTGRRSTPRHIRVVKERLDSV